MTPATPDHATPDAAQSDLRAISDSFLAQIERLTALEELKRETPVDDPAFPRLAQEVEEMTRALLARATSQNLVAREVHADAVSDGGTTTIEEIPAGTPVARILALWREVERELADAEPGSPRARELERRSAAFRTAYQRAYESARAAE